VAFLQEFDILASGSPPIKASTKAHAPTSSQYAVHGASPKSTSGCDRISCDGNILTLGKKEVRKNSPFL
jgi:hypothetical protein